MLGIEALENRVLFTTWYVAPAGGDLRRGTLQRPFRTIQHAAKVSQPGDTIIIRKGVYHETVTPPTSGTPDAPITFEAYPGEAVVIDGADPLTGWRRAKAGLLTSARTWSLGDGQNQLFQSGQMLSEARWPAASSDDLAFAQNNLASVSEVLSNVQNADGLLTVTVGVAALTDPSGAWVGATIHIAMGQQWVFQTGMVTDSEPGSLTFTLTPLDPIIWQTPTAGDRFYLSGTTQGLSLTGQWFRNAAGTLSLKTGTPGLPKAGTIELKRRLYGFDLSGLSSINLTGIHLQACTINTDADSNHITIDSIQARYVSHDLVNANPWADKLAPHTTGILLNGTDITLMNSRIDFSSGDGVFVGGSGNTVENCAITNTDYSGFDEAGITTMGANETITGNTVERTGRSGIVIRYSPATSVTHNFLTGIGLLTTDFGGIYTFDTDGGGAEIAYNIVEGYHSAGFGSSGIFLDDGSSNYVVDHNLAYDVDYGMKMNPPVPSNMVFNNTLSGSQWSLLGNKPDGWDGTQLVNNIFLGPTSIGNNVLSSNNLFDLPMSQFVNPASGDYRLAPGAVAIGDGEFLPPYLVTAPGRAPDVGAYEFGTTPFAAGAMI